MEDKKIKVHKLVNEVFGRETTLFDIFTIFIGSVSLAIVTLLLVWEIDLSFTKKMVLTLLALDIGGGVVANFTDGTNNYYEESSKKRYLFVFFHILQPLLLAWIYPTDLYNILAIPLYTLLSSLFILNIKVANRQRVVGATFLFVGILIVQSLNFANQVLQLMLFMYSIKLMLAFSVDWAKTDK